MTDLELISLTQRLGLEGAKAKPNASVYIATCDEEDEYNFIMNLVRTALIANQLIEEVHRRRFARQVTETVRIIERGKK